MEKIKFNGSFYVSEIVLTVKDWEKLKKKGDKELYKKYNKYSDYEELRIYFNENHIDLESHCIKENKGVTEDAIK